MIFLKRHWPKEASLEDVACTAFPLEFHAVKKPIKGLEIVQNGGQHDIIH